MCRYEYIRTHTPPFLSAKQVWFVKIKDKVSEENSLRFSSVGPENTLRFSSFILTTKSIHPTFIEASYELLPSQENTRLNLFFHKKKKNLLEKGSHGLLPRQENTRHTPIPTQGGEYLQTLPGWERRALRRHSC